MPSRELNASEGTFKKEPAYLYNEVASDSSNLALVSFLAEVPAPLQDSMATFVENHPKWDQYRLIQAALAGFLLQNDVESRSVSHL